MADPKVIVGVPVYPTTGVRSLGTGEKLNESNIGRLATDLANGLEYVKQQQEAAGDSVKATLFAAKAAATSNVASLTGSVTLDGVLCSGGDRVFLFQQSNQAQNGPWVVGTPWARPSDFDANAKVVSGQLISITSGATFANAIFQLVSSGPFVLGSTNLVWSQVGGSGGSSAGTIQPVDIVLTSNDTLSGLAARDGVTPTAGSRVLATAQSTASQNGVYVAASGAWTRAADCDADGDLILGQQIYVKSGGTLGGDTRWYLQSGTTIAGSKTYVRVVPGAELDTIEPEDLSDTIAAAGDSGKASPSNHRHKHGTLAGGGLHSVATTVAHGFMSSDDKLEHDRNTTYVDTRNGAWLNVTEPFTISGTTYQVKTTNTPAQNQIALQTAMDYLSQGGLAGGTIWIGPGTFDHSEAFNRPPYVNLCGAGPYATKLRLSPTVAPTDQLRQWTPLNLGAVGGHSTVGIQFICGPLTGTRAWAPSTAFSLNEYVRVNLPSPIVLKCITAGTSGAFRPLGELLPRVRSDNTMRLRGTPPAARKVWVKCVLGGILGVARFQFSLDGGSTYGTAGNGYNVAYNSSDPTTYYQSTYHAISNTYTLETGFSVEIAQTAYATNGGPSSDGIYKPYPRVRVTGTPNADRRIDVSAQTAGQLGTFQYNALYNSGLHAPSGVNTGTQSTTGGASYTVSNVGGSGQNIVFYDGDYWSAEASLYRCPQNQFSLVEGDVIQDGTCVWQVLKGTAAIDDVASSQWHVSHCSFYDHTIGVSLCQSEGVTLADNDWRRGNWFACVWLHNDSDRYFGTSGGFTNNITITGHNVMFASGLGVVDDGGFIFTLRDGNFQGISYGNWFAGRYDLGFTKYYSEGANTSFGSSSYAGRFTGTGVCRGITIQECLILTTAPYAFDFFYAGGAIGLKTHGNVIYCTTAAYGNLDQVYNVDISASDVCLKNGPPGGPLPIADKMGLEASAIATAGVHHRRGLVALHPAALAVANGTNRGVVVANTRNYVTAPTGAWTLGSIVPPGTAFTDGTEIEITDLSGQLCTVTHEDTGEATAANRIVCPGSVDAVVTTGRLRLIYLKSQSRWYLLNSGSLPGVTYTWYNKNAPGAAAAPYITLDGIQASTAAGPGQIEVGRAFVANYASFRGVTALSGASVTVTVQKNGVDTALTFTIADGGVSASDTAHAVPFAKGDTIGVKAVQSATVAQAAWHGRFCVSGPAM